MGEILEFKVPEEAPVIEHVDSTTIVEKVEWSPELEEQFKRAGFDVN